MDWNYKIANFTDSGITHSIVYECLNENVSMLIDAQRASSGEGYSPTRLFCTIWLYAIILNLILTTKISQNDIICEI